MQITMQVKNQTRLDEWLAMAEKSPALERILKRADGWAKGMEILFSFRERPTLSLEDVERIDRFGTAKRFLIEVWKHSDELARQFQVAQEEELKALAKLRKRNHS